MKRDWFQLFTNIALVAGLVVVVYEVNRNNVHKRAELATVSFEMSLSRRSASLGDDPSPILAKAMSEPENLSLAELVFMDDYNNHVLLEMWHYSYMYEAGIYTDENWRITVDQIAKSHFGYPFGRKWWASRRTWVGDLSVRDVVDEALSNEPNFRVTMFESFE